jgi:TRAP-type C4-dicarboxylate transport system permease small subunit
MLKRLNILISGALLIVASVLAFAISFIVVADVIGRVVFNSPLKGTPEMVAASLVMILFLQATYAVSSGGMINVDFLFSRMPSRVQSYVMAFGCFLGMCFFALVAYGAIDPAIYSWESGEFEGEGSLRVPSWPARFVVVLGAALTAASYLLLAIDNLHSGLHGRGPVQSSSGSGGV